MTAAARPRPVLVSLVAVQLAAAASFAAPSGPGLVPWPAAMQLEGPALELGPGSRIVAADAALAPLAAVLAGEIRLATGLQLATAEGQPVAGDIGLALDAALKAEHYRLKVSDRAVVRGGDYGGVAWGTVSLLQALSAKDGKAVLPGMGVEDRPARPYRGVMIDVARRRNTISELKRCVVLCRFYKIRYLHLHLSDDHAWTFPSTAFPKLGLSNNGYQGPAPEVYDLEELKGLARFADERGVTIVPEIDVPGHTDALRIGYPDWFDADQGPAHMGILNMANEKAYEGLDKLIGEILAVFSSSPYFHFGADEPRLDNEPGSRHYEPYLKQHGLKDAHELYLHFIARMDAIVKKHGRRSMIWADFGGAETDKAKVPTDVVCMAWQNGSNAGDVLSKKGYEVVNATWNPLYVVNKTLSAPEIANPAGRRQDREAVYGWNLFKFDTCTVEPTPKVIGAQVCAWEEGGEVQVPALRGRVSAMSERVWNPDAGRSFEDFASRAEAGDPLLDKLVEPYPLSVPARQVN